MDREKVIKGFECCHVMVHDLGPDKTSCGVCPYKDVQTEEQIDLGGIECIAVLHDDALALLKEQEAKQYNNHEVACILADLFGDPCACNFNDIDTWLPYKCDFRETCCPNPVGVACWEQYLKHREGR